MIREKENIRSLSPDPKNNLIPIDFFDFEKIKQVLLTIYKKKYTISQTRISKSKRIG